jgi:NitT/TauT family transport system substrate-binding protein
MVKRLASRLAVASETQITIIGTLLISAGINLITSLDLLTPNPATFYDALRILLAVPITYLGIIFFWFIDVSKEWTPQQGKFHGADLLSKRQKHIENALASKHVLSCIRHLYICLVLFLFPALLLTFYVCKEWAFMKSKVLSLLLASVAFFGCTKNPAPDLKPVVIGYQQIALYRHLFTAKEKGFFDQEGVKVDLQNVPSGNGMMEGLISGQLDGGGLVNLQVGLTVQAKDPNRFNFVNFQVWRDKSYPDYILIRSGSNIKSIKELEGHTMGLHPGSAVKAFSRVVLQHFNVDVDKVNFIELEPSVMQAAVTAGRVDAVYAMDPVATTLVDTGQCTVLVPNPMQYIFPSPVPISGSALSTKFLNERPEDARKVIRALDNAILYMREPGHEDEIAGYIAKYTPITKEMALRLNPSEYWTLTEADRARVQELASRFEQLQIVNKAGDVNSIIFPVPASAANGRKQ